MSDDWEHSSTVHDHSTDAETSRDDKVWYQDDIEKFRPGFNCAPRNYAGSGTSGDPFIVDWDLDDREDPYNWSKNKKWLMTMQVSIRILSRL
jgi:hypothetical protein